MCWFCGYKQFNHLAKLFSVISVLTEANDVPDFKLIFTADEKAKFNLKPAQFLERKYAEPQ